MKKFEYLVTGGANLDITGTTSNPLLPADSNPGRVKTSPGGVARNIAENLQRLGNSTALISILGDDFGYTAIVQSCQKAGIDVSNLITDKNLSTGTYLAVNNDQGALSVAVADMAAIDHLLPDVLNDKKQALDNAEQLVIEANLPQQTLQWIANNSQNQPIHADAVSATKAIRLKPLLNQLDILKVNRLEAATLLDWQKPSDDQAMAQALYQLGVKKVLLSLGAKGAILYSETGCVHQSAIKTRSISNTGSGDALFSGMIAAQSLLKSPSHQLEFAVACATFTLGSMNAVNPDLTVATITQQFLSHIPAGAWY
jgi:pseudouridine kinase